MSENKKSVKRVLVLDENIIKLLENRAMRYEHFDVFFNILHRWLTFRDTPDCYSYDYDWSQHEIAEFLCNSFGKEVDD